MKNVQEYEAVSRVVKDKNVIGLMVRDVTKRKKEVYMSMESFDELVRQQELNDEQPAKNPRNAAVCAICLPVFSSPLSSQYF